jgi:hypothetical protein
LSKYADAVDVPKPLALVVRTQAVKLSGFPIVQLAGGNVVLSKPSTTGKGEAFTTFMYAVLVSVFVPNEFDTVNDTV